MSKTSYHHAWETSQLAGHGWVGLATLAGIPYDTLFVEEMPADQELSKYSTLVFAQATLVDDATYSQIGEKGKRWSQRHPPSENHVGHGSPT